VKAEPGRLAAGHLQGTKQELDESLGSRKTILKGAAPSVCAQSQRGTAAQHLTAQYPAYVH